MADPDLYVDLDALNELVRQLGQIRSSLQGAKDSINTYDASLGSERIEDALNGFVSGWKDGRKKIIEGIDSLLGRCEGSINTYLENEQRIIDATKAGG